MLTYGAAFVLLWLLIVICRSNGECQASSPTFNVPSRNDSSLNEEAPTKSYTYNNRPEPSRLLSPGKDTLECARPWSCCDQEITHDILPNGILKCGKQGSFSIPKTYCATFDEEANILEAGHCLYNYNLGGVMFTGNMSMLNEFMCETALNLHRTGTLCGKCQDGYYPLAYSFDMNCVHECRNSKSNWWKFVLAAFLPLTFFCIFIMLFRINVISSRFQGFLFYAQMWSTPAIVRTLIFLGESGSKSESRSAHVAVRCMASFYGIWNLDFFRSLDFGICLGTDTLQTLALDLIVAVYPLLLMVMFYILLELYDRNFRLIVIIWKPFRRLFGLFRENWDLRTSLIDAFATTFLLTNVKFQGVSFDLLTPVIVYHLNTTGNWATSLRLFYDATIPYFGSRHLPYAIMALTILLLFAILPVLLLVLYPFRCFQKLLNLFPVRWYILHTFLDTFYGSYKDGTQPGTRDCRWFASLFILSRFCLIFVCAFAKTEVYFPFAAAILSLVALFFIIFQPFKDDVSHFTTINAYSLLLLALWHTSFIGAVMAGEKNAPTMILLYFTITMVLSIIPLLYISAIVLHWMYSQREFGADVVRRLRAWRSGYVALT